MSDKPQIDPQRWPTDVTSPMPVQRQGSHPPVPDTTGSPDGVGRQGAPALSAEREAEIRSLIQPVPDADDEMPFRGLVPNTHQTCRDAVADLLAELRRLRQQVARYFERMTHKESQLADLKRELGVTGKQQDTAIQAVRSLRQQVAQLRAVCAEAYQLAGAYGAPVEALDNLLCAANGKPLLHETFLPVANQWEQKVAQLEAELSLARSDARRWKDASDANREHAMANEDERRRLQRELAAAQARIKELEK